MVPTVKYDRVRPFQGSGGSQKTSCGAVAVVMVVGQDGGGWRASMREASQVFGFATVAVPDDGLGRSVSIKNIEICLYKGKYIV